MILFAVSQHLNRQRKHLTNDTIVINNDGKVNSSSKTSSKSYYSNFKFSGLLLTIIQTVGSDTVRVHLEEAERRETREYKTYETQDSDSESGSAGSQRSTVRLEERLQRKGAREVCPAALSQYVPTHNSVHRAARCFYHVRE